MNSLIRTTILLLLLVSLTVSNFKRKIAIQSNSSGVDYIEYIIRNVTNRKNINKKDKLEIKDDVTTAIEEPFPEEVATTENRDEPSRQNLELTKQSKSERKMAKLNLKQGLTMNQILDVYALKDSPNELCRNHSNEFGLGMRAFEPWALKSKK